MHGYGELIWENWRSYKGYFLKGQMYGQGIQTWPSGQKIEGEWYNGIIQKGTF